MSLRLLRKLLLNEDSVKVDRAEFVQTVLVQIGQSLLAPVIASFFIPNADGQANGDESGDSEFLEYLKSLRLSELYSKDGCSILAEEVMIIRYLVKHSESWAVAVTEALRANLKGNLDREVVFDADSCKKWMFPLFGALGVFGGYVDSVRVGTKCYYVPERIVATVTSRSYSKSQVSLIRDAEQSHLDGVAIGDIVCIGDEVWC